MTVDKKGFNTVDEYIKTFPDDVQAILEKVRKTIRNVVPEGKEVISYQIPAVKVNGKNLIFFAAWKSHISLYPIPTGTEAFRKEISQYIAGKGTLKFSLDKPIPYELIKKITTVSLKEHLERNSKY